MLEFTDIYVLVLCLVSGSLTFVFSHGRGLSVCSAFGLIFNKRIYIVSQYSEISTIEN